MFTQEGRYHHFDHQDRSLHIIQELPDGGEETAPPPSLKIQIKLAEVPTQTPTLKIEAEMPKGITTIDLTPRGTSGLLAEVSGNQNLAPGLSFVDILRLVREGIVYAGTNKRVHTRYGINSHSVNDWSYHKGSHSFDQMDQHDVDIANMAKVLKNRTIADTQYIS